MKKRRFIIIFLLVIGILGFGIRGFMVKAKQENQKSKYQLEQQDALTHDFKSVLKYRNKYMGNNSNIINLNYELPLSTIPRSNEINLDKHQYTINYKETVLGIEEEKVKADLIYNATANFALIDNLEAINFSFIESSYNITRSDVQKWYKIDLALLTDKTKWKNEVQEKLSDKTYVDRFWKTNFKEKK